MSDWWSADAPAPTAPAPAQAAKPDEWWSGDKPVEPPISSAAMPAIKSAVEPVLNAFGQGFREGFGPDRLGLTEDSVKWLSKAGIFEPEGHKSYTSPFYAFNELLAQTIWTAPELLLRGGGGLLRGGQAAVAQIGEQFGQPQLGRDIAAIPEAFFGSPHPLGIPKARGEPVVPGEPLREGPVERGPALPAGAVQDGTAYKLPISGPEGAEVGHIKFEVDSNDLIRNKKTIQVSGAQIDDAADRGKGYGVEAYQKLADFALSTGRELWSDRSVSPEAARVYDALERRGYTVVKGDENEPRYGAQYKVTAGPAAEPPIDLPTARDLGVIGPERPPITEGTPVEAAERAVTVAAEQKRPEVKTQEVGGKPGVTDKAGNIRLDLIDKPADVLNVIRQAAEEQGGADAFMPARQGDIPLKQQEMLSDATGIAVPDLDVRGMGRLMKNDNEVRLAIQAMIQSAEDTSAAMKKAAATDAPEDLIEFQRLRMRHSILQEQVAGLTAEWGRTGNVFQEFAERAKDAKGLGEFLKDKKGETIDDLREMAKAGSVLDRGQLAKFMNDARREPPGKIYWTWVNGLISGLITHTKYVFANATYAATERGVITPMAAILGKAKEAFGAETDRVFLGETAASMWGMIAATPTSLLATAKSMKAGMRAPLESEIALRDAAIARGERVPASLDKAVNQFTQMQRPIEGVWGRIIGAPGDMAMGIHTFFKIIGERAGLEEEGYRAAIKEGLSLATDPEAFTQRWAWHSAHPTEAMMARAVEGAYKGTFMGELGPHGKAWQRFTKETPGLKWLFPFSHIPVNLMKATYEYTPFAFLDSEMTANLTGKNGGIAQDKAIARMVVGSSVMGYLTHLQMTGRATGDYPQDPKERDSWKLQGKQPNSVLVNGYWVSYDKFGPAGSLANIGANIGAVVAYLKSEDDDAMTKATWHAAYAASHIIVNEVGFMSLQNMFEAIHDEKKGAAWAASTAGSFIPFSSLLSQSASWMDPSMREAKTFVDGLKYRIPVVRESLLPKRDWSGTPVANPQYGNIIRQRQVNTDPVDNELEHLGIHPAPPENRIGGVKLPPKLYDTYQSTAGPFTRQTLESMVSAPGWHDLPAFVREETIHSTIKSTRASAAAAMQAAYPQIIAQGIENRVRHLQGEKPTKLAQ